MQLNPDVSLSLSLSLSLHFTILLYQLAYKHYSNTCLDYQAKDTIKSIIIELVN